MPNRHRIQFPPRDTGSLSQDQVEFTVFEGNKEVRLRFHDYDAIYRRPGLYEQLFYDRLKCTSPKKVGEMLKHSLDKHARQMTELRVLDLGAGNGMMGEVLKNFGVSRIVGADIIPEARDACFRDRPGIYDAYYVEDFSKLEAPTIEELDGWSFDCLTCVAALGFGDIPADVFLRALRFLEVGGWAAFNIKHKFLDTQDKSGFSLLIRELMFSDHVDLHHLELYRHRLSMEGTPLHYYGCVMRLKEQLPEDFLRRLEIAG